MNKKVKLRGGSRRVLQRAAEWRMDGCVEGEKERDEGMRERIPLCCRDRRGGRAGRIEQKTSVFAPQEGITHRASSPHTPHQQRNNPHKNPRSCSELPAFRHIIDNLIINTSCSV